MVTPHITKDQSIHYFKLFKYTTIYPVLGKKHNTSGNCHTAQHKSHTLLFGELLETCSELQWLTELMENLGRVKSVLSGEKTDKN